PRQHVFTPAHAIGASPGASGPRDGIMTTRFARPLISLLLLLPAWTLPLHAFASPPRLMLATSYEEGIDASRYWVSEKLDGVRGRWDGRALWTRGGHRVDAPTWFTEGWPPVPMDGELWLGRGRFEDASGTVRAGDADDPAWRRMRFMVFDLPDDPGKFTERVLHMRSLLDAAGIDWLRPVTQYRASGAVELDALLEAVVAAGGEGLM